MRPLTDRSAGCTLGVCHQPHHRGNTSLTNVFKSSPCNTGHRCTIRLRTLALQTVRGLHPGQMQRVGCGAATPAPLSTSGLPPTPRSPCSKGKLSVVFSSWVVTLRGSISAFPSSGKSHSHRASSTLLNNSSGDLNAPVSVHIFTTSRRRWLAAIAAGSSAGAAFQTSPCCCSRCSSGRGSCFFQVMRLRGSFAGRTHDHRRPTQCDCHISTRRGPQHVDAI